MPPDYLTQVTFCGRTTGLGVNPDLADVLAAVEKDVRSTFDALDDADKQDENGQPVTFEDWVGLREPIIGYRKPPAGYHGSGSAVDINYTTNPYIVTRTIGSDGSVVLGGEKAGADLVGVRQAAVDVYDRACQFMRGTQADVAPRRGPPRESTADVYARFSATSTALAAYLGVAFLTNNHVIQRPPVDDAENADTGALDTIPTTERREKDDALATIQAQLDAWSSHGGRPEWVGDNPEDVYYRILRDYELVRTPMLFGNPVASPPRTRNPAFGFLDLRVELVVSLCDVGLLRWGACDFGPESGDVQHFDLNGHGRQGQYPPA